jgi:uroporphyrinogen decarboxylase
MTSRDRILRTLNHQSVDRAPRDLWVPAETEPSDELAEIQVRFPSDIVHVDVRTPSGKRGKAAPRSGLFIDAWGCTWETDTAGQANSLVGHPLADAAKLAAYELPAEVLDVAALERIQQRCAGSTRFVLAWSNVRPWERFAMLRGPEAAAADLHGGAKEIRPLLAKLHDFSLGEIETLARSEVDGVVLHDDWNVPGGPRVSARTWRTYFKSYFRQYCDILHSHDKFVFLSTAGQIGDMLPDLLEFGLDAIYAPALGGEIEKFAEKHRRQTTFWIDLSPLGLVPPTTPAAIHEAVLRLRRALDFGLGGVIARCQWAPCLTIRNVATYFEDWMAPLPVTA